MATHNTHKGSGAPRKIHISLPENKPFTPKGNLFSSATKAHHFRFFLGKKSVKLWGKFR